MSIHSLETSIWTETKFILKLIIEHWNEKAINNLDESGKLIAGRNINNLRYADDTTFMAESKEELKSLLMMKEESEKAGKTQHSKN